MSKVGYRKAATVAAGGPSPIIWADCPVVAMQKDPGKGVHIFEDFIGKIVTLAAVGQFGQFYVAGDNLACSQATDAYDGEHGVAVLIPTGAAYDEAYFVSPVLYELKLNSRKKFWFEVRFELPDVTDDMSLIAGLGENAMLDGASVLEANATPDTVEDKDFIGFVAFTGTGDKIHDIDAVYHEEGDAALTQVKDAARAQSEWTNEEYVKLGMRYDGIKYVKFYIDGVLVGTLDVDDFDANTANELDPLGVIVGCMANDASAPHLDVDWIRFAFER